MTSPSPLLDEDDPVVADVLRLAGLPVDTTSRADPQPLIGAEGLTVADAIAACLQNREHYYGHVASLLEDTIISNIKGWAEDTELLWVPWNNPIGTTDDSQPNEGTWLVADPEDDRIFGQTVFIIGWAYDRYAAAASLLENLATRLKMQFNFSDGSGAFNRESKFSMVTQSARMLRAKASAHSVTLTRHDTGVNDEVEAGFHWPPAI